MIPVQQYAAAGDGGAPTVYELEGRNTNLPKVNFFRSVKRMLFNDVTVSKLNRLETRSSFAIGLVFNICLLLMLPALCNAGGIGEPMAVVLALCHVPGMLVTVGNMRTEMAWLLIRRFDWWYFSIANSLYIVCFVIYLRDLRAVIAPNVWIMPEIAIMADAQVSTLGAIALSSLLAALTQLVFGMAIILNWIETPDLTLATYSVRHYKLSIRDLLINSIAHMVVLLMRMSYNKWIHMKERRRLLTEAHNNELKLTTARCSIYRCFVQLRSVHSVSSVTRTSTFTQINPGRTYSSASVSRRVSGPGVATFVSCPRSTPLRYTQVDIQFESNDVPVPMIWTYVVGPAALKGSRACRHSVFITFYFLGAFGFIITLSCFTEAPEALGTSRMVWATIGAFTSFIFCSTFAALHQRKLLRRLWRSFDYVYLLLQVVLALSSVCDLLLWTPARCLPVISIGIWAHWVLTLDAVPPCARQALRFSEMLELPILITGIIAQLVLVFDLFKWHTWSIPDRILLQVKVAGVDVELRVMPFLLTRLLGVFTWNCRLLWRVSKLAYAHQVRGDTGDNRLTSHLVMLTGNVEYDYKRKLRQRSLTQRGIQVVNSRQVVSPPTIT